jgi:hypothetical protein
VSHWYSHHLYGFNYAHTIPQIHSHTLFFLTTHHTIYLAQALSLFPTCAQTCISRSRWLGRALVSPLISLHTHYETHTHTPTHAHTSTNTHTHTKIHTHWVQWKTSSWKLANRNDSALKKKELFSSSLDACPKERTLLRANQRRRGKEKTSFLRLSIIFLKRSLSLKRSSFVFLFHL